MVIHALAAICGLAVVAAATHANVLAVGGWHSADAPLIVTVAALLAVGMAFAATVWRSGSRLPASALIACLIAGEGYWLIINTEREMTSRETAAAPYLAAAARRAEAQARVKEAQAALGAVPEASSRLAAALAAKGEADAAARDKSTERGCAANCRQLLQRQVDNATAEIVAARAGDDLHKAALARGVAEAKAALALFPVPVAHASLAGHVGIPQWQYDVGLAVLRSLAIIGGSLALALAIHPATASASVAASVAPAPVSAPQDQTVPVARKRSPREHLSRFLSDVIEPDSNGQVSLRELHRRYSPWCRERGEPMLLGEALGDELKAIFEALHLPVELGNADAVIIGARLIPLAISPRDTMTH